MKESSGRASSFWTDQRPVSGSEPVDEKRETMLGWNDLENMVDRVQHGHERAPDHPKWGSVTSRGGCKGATLCAVNPDANDGVALDAMPKGIRPHRMVQGSAPESDESSARRAVRYPVSWKRRILLLGAEAVTRCERYGAFFRVFRRIPGWIHVEKMCGRT